MEVSIDKHQQEIQCLTNLFGNKSVKISPNIDYDYLKIYDENNEHLPMAILIDEDEQTNCPSRYELQRIKLQFDTKTELWKMIPLESDGDGEEENFNCIFDDLQCVALDQQIENILQRYNQHSLGELRDVIKENPTTIPIAIPEEDEQEKDTIDYSFNSRPPPIAPRRSRQNSVCSTQSSVRYASFLPPTTAPTRRRRVIESILLHVQRKKKPFEKLVDVFRGIERPTIHQLGLEFLRVYDGRFNYRQGHTFQMSFRNKTWFLTIDQIKYIDCPMGEIGPRSVLILNYKGQYANVQV